MPDKHGRPIEDDVFVCELRVCYLLLGECLEDYAKASAFEDHSSPCYDCIQGRGNRKCFSRGISIPEQFSLDGETKIS